MIGATKSKNIGLVFLCMLVGLIIGGFIGDFFAGYKYIGIISKAVPMGLTNPVKLDFGILSLGFYFNLKVNFAGIIGMFVAIFIYKKLS